MLQLNNFYYHVFQIAVCSVLSDLMLIPSTVFCCFFFISVIVFFSSGQFFFHVFCLSVVLTRFTHSSPKFGEHLYDHYFQLFIS